MGLQAGDRRQRTLRTEAISRASGSDSRLNINTATQKELEALPGIGPVIARRIIEGRPYRSVDDLNRVKGIGKKRLDEIRLLVTAESATIDTPLEPAGSPASPSHRQVPSNDETARPSEGVKPTNNAAGCASRHAVIWRRISDGTDSEVGSRFVERMWSMVATCRQQDINVVDYLTGCHQAHLDGQPDPSLTPTPATTQAAEAVIKAAAQRVNPRLDRARQ